MCLSFFFIFYFLFCLFTSTGLSLLAFCIPLDAYLLLLSDFSQENFVFGSVFWPISLSFIRLCSLKVLPISITSRAFRHKREKGHPIHLLFLSPTLFGKLSIPYALRGIQHKLRLSQWYPPDLAEMQAVRGLWYGSVGLLPSCYYDLAQELNDDILEDSRVLCVFWWVVYCLLGPLIELCHCVLHFLLCFNRTARGGHFSHCCWVAETLAKI